MILIDSSVLIDIVNIEARGEIWSEQQALLAKKSGKIAINLVIYAEISRDFLNKSQLDLFLSGAAISVEPMNEAVAYAAALAHEKYRQAGGLRSATLPDFFIGAHASTMGYILLTRDPKRIRTYFPDVNLITPE